MSKRIKLLIFVVVLSMCLLAACDGTTAPTDAAAPTITTQPQDATLRLMPFIR